jgi:hypothetical protein
MTRRIHLWPEEHRRRDDQIEVPAVLERVRGKPVRLYFRVPMEEQANLTPAVDPFVLLTAFHVLGAGADLEVHGAVSPSLLRGLEEFQAAWCRWRPDRYRPFSVKAEVEREEAREASGRAVMTFSGGLDSCCTAWRHTRGSLGRRKRRVKAAVMVHGFDIPLDQDDVFQRAEASSRAILDSIGIPLIPVVCNVRVLRDDWEDLHGAALAGCLHLLAGGYSTGLIASSHVYETPRIPWGSNPVTDPMLGNSSFSIVHDGCELTRSQKAREIGDWATGQKHLRVCWEGKHLDRNCGACLRCLHTGLCFAAVGRPIPPSIPLSCPGEGVERLLAHEPTPVQLNLFENLALTARKSGLTDSWIAELESLIDSHRRTGLTRPVDRYTAIRRRVKSMRHVFSRRRS